MRAAIHHLAELIALSLFAAAVIQWAEIIALNALR